LESDSLLLKEPDIDPETGLPEDPLLQEKYSDNDIHMWPTTEPGNDTLFNLMNPFPRTGNTDVDAVADDRSIVYATGPPAAGAGRALVFLNFDEAIYFSGLRLIGGKGVGNVAHVAGRAGGSGLRSCGKGKGKKMEEKDIGLEAITARKSDVKGKDKAVVGCRKIKGDEESAGFWWIETARWKIDGRGWIRDAVVVSGNADVSVGDAMTGL